MEKFSVVVHEDPEGGYWGEVPALAGCYSQGETIDELMTNIPEAIAGVLEVLPEQGRQPEANVTHVTDDLVLAVRTLRR